jgi:hypothetical protein
MAEKPRTSIWSVVLAVIITAIVVGGGMYLWQNTKTPAQTPSDEVTDTQPAQTSDTEEAEEEEETDDQTERPKIEQGYSNESPQWDSFKSDIETETGETLESFYAPESPDNEDVIFISTSSEITGEWPDVKSTNKIYSYNIQTGELSKLYEEQETRLIRTMGIEGDKLIVMLDGIDNSPGPCFSIWADWKNFGYLDIEDPDTLMPYTVPDYMVQKGEAEQEECEEVMGL